MADKAWKAFERRVADFLGGERTPLSGGNGKITRADVIHNDLFVEAKQRAKMAVWTLWDKTRAMAKEEDKIPMLALSEKYRSGWLVVVHCDNLHDVLDIMGGK